MAQDESFEDLEPIKSEFKVPEKYFEELPFTINAKREVKKVETVFWLWTGSVIAVCSVILVLFLFDKGEKQVDYYSESTEGDVYSQEYFDQEISEEDLIDFMINSEQEFN